MKKNRLLPSFRRNLRRLMMPVAMCSVALMAASCSKATDDDSTTLPEGKYPMEFTATGLQVAAVTRATTDGSWDGDENIAIHIDSETKEYVAAQNGTLSAATDVTPFYWQTSNETKTVSAWYCGTGYNASLPTTWTVEANQSGDGYQKSDFLYAPATDITFANRNDTPLHFCHQTTKVTVHILRGDKTPADVADKITSLTIGDNTNISLRGNWEAPTTPWTEENQNVCGKWSASSEAAAKGIITPRSLAQQSVTVDGREKRSLASYQALVIPQVINAESSLFKIDIDGYSSFYYKPKQDIVWQPGTEHTYYITINGSTLSVSTSSSIGWGTEGASGSGSVTLPKIIDLSTEQEPINISDDKAYLILGSGTQTLTVSGGKPEIYLDNASITVSSGNAISITDGSPIIHVQGNNTVLSDNDTGLAVSGGASVTIIGNSTTDVLTANGGKTEVSGNYGASSTAGAGIGSPVGGTLGGNITIRNVTVKATGGTLKEAGGGAGIGSSSNGPCGDITIENSIITANGGLFSAGIGMGCNYNTNPPSIGDISITDSDVTAKGGMEASAIGFPYSSLIGSSGTYKAGKITIATDDEDLFLSKLTPGENLVPDVFATTQRVGKGTYLRVAIPILRNTANTDSWEGVTINEVEYKNGVD